MRCSNASVFWSVQQSKLIKTRNSIFLLKNVCLPWMTQITRSSWCWYHINSTVRSPFIPKSIQIRRPLQGCFGKILPSSSGVRSFTRFAYTDSTFKGDIIIKSHVDFMFICNDISSYTYRLQYTNILTIPLLISCEHYSDTHLNDFLESLVLDTHIIDGVQ